MPEQRLQRCLLLCAQARSERGNALHATLDALQESLEALASTPWVTADPHGEPPPTPIVTMDMTGYLTGWNEGAQRLFGYTADEAIGQHILFLYADEPGGDMGDIPELFLEHGSSLIEVHRKKKSGEVFRANLSLKPLLDENDQPTGLIASLTELRDQLSPEERMALHASIIEDSAEGILITDATERIVSVNAAFTRITGYLANEAIGQTPDLLRSGVHSADLRAQIRAAIGGDGAWHGEIVGRRKDGDLFPQSVSIGVVRNATDEITHAFAVFSDISVLRAAEERMQQLVNYDSLTGLPNRTLFLRLVEQSLASARRSHNGSALLEIDLNRFASVNDSLGHEIGDELLRQVGQRFRAKLRDEDILARFGGDEFVIALVTIQKREHAGLVAKKLLDTLREPFVIESHALNIGASIGISTFPEDGRNTVELQRAADAAMKQAQTLNDSSYLFYSPEMNVRAKEQWQLEGELRAALAADQLRLYYQPKISLRTGRIVGAEALIRWPHPVHGMIPPTRFIPIAEETGLIFDIGRWVLDESCRQIRAWLDAGLDPMPIAVNLSARQFDGQLPERLCKVVEDHRIPTELLRLEITESLLVRGPETVIPLMNELVAMGFHLSLDDFGTGYSSLAYLKKFPITTLKIDRAFVIGVPHDENDCAIAQAIVTMGKQLRHEIVAEGVETYDQMLFLRSLGCDQLQGYFFSPPVSADVFAQMCNEGRHLVLD